MRSGHGSGHARVVGVSLTRVARAVGVSLTLVAVAIITPLV